MFVLVIRRFMDGTANPTDVTTEVYGIFGTTKEADAYKREADEADETIFDRTVCPINEIRVADRDSHGLEHPCAGSCPPDKDFDEMAEDVW